MIKLQIIQSELEPSKDTLWYHKINGVEVLLKFTSRGWETIGHITVDIQDPQYGEEEIVVEPIITPVFFLGNDDDIKQRNLHTASTLESNTYLLVELKGKEYGTTYNTTGHFYDGIIYTSIGNFDVNYNNGEVSRIYEEDNITAISLQVAHGEGSENELHIAENLKELSRVAILSVFFCRIEYGYGTGSFNPNVGGQACVITHQGVIIKYNIGADGSVMKADEPNEIDLFKI